jgi:hypothetical protein
VVLSIHTQQLALAIAHQATGDIAARNRESRQLGQSTSGTAAMGHSRTGYLETGPMDDAESEPGRVTYQLAVRSLGNRDTAHHDRLLDEALDHRDKISVSGCVGINHTVEALPQGFAVLEAKSLCL